MSLKKNILTDTDTQKLGAVNHRNVLNYSEFIRIVNVHNSTGIFLNLNIFQYNYLFWVLHFTITNCMRELAESLDSYIGPTDILSLSAYVYLFCQDQIFSKRAF